jgi:hypothetical protein
VVTATNTGGSTTATVTIGVVAAVPTALTYSTNPATYTVGTAIAANTPSNSGGAVVSYAVNPTLPAGLSLNTASGVISGTPTTLTAAAGYVVTATNTGGSTTATVTIGVVAAAPTALTYSTNPATYTKGSAITSNTPTSLGGAVTGYAISPALPAGLSFNTTTGVIAGTPTALAGATGYLVTASNSGGSTTATVTITVSSAANSAPTVGAITLPDGVKINTSVTGTATFADADASDVHTATWDWGDGTQSAGTVSEAAKTVTGSHTYALTNLYTVTLTVTDAAAASGQNWFRFANVYNPATGAGYLSGSGQVNSPAGAFPSNPGLAGLITVSQITVKYGTDGTLGALSNKFNFTYTPGSLSFNSTSVGWLVVSGTKAWLKGEGWSNVSGVSDMCYFLVSIIDSSTSADRVRVKIWSKTTGVVVYDSLKDGTGASLSDDTPPTQTSTSPLMVMILH